MNASVDITNYMPFLATLLGGGVAVTLIAQAVKKVFGLDSSHVIHLMVVAVSIVLAAAQYVLQSKNLPPEVLGVSGATIYGISQLVYNEAGFAKTLLSRVQISVAPAAPALATAAAGAEQAPAAPAEPSAADIAPAVEPAVVTDASASL